MHCAKHLFHRRNVTMDTKTGYEQADPVEIRFLTEADARSFRALRLTALREFPEAFGMTYAEERDDYWPEYLQRFQTEWISGDNVILGAFLGGQLVGALGLRRWKREKQRHKGYIWIFYVEPEVRGNGLGRRLLNAGLQYARQLPELAQVQLSVAAGSQSARSLYVSLGFEPFGLERKALKVHDTFIDLELMALHLS